MEELPFTAEYAKSNRAGCKSCKMNIAKDDLRLGVMVQSAHFDGRIPMWYHYECFWRIGKTAQLKSEAEIHHFENLRWEDQEKIRQRISGSKGGRKSVGGSEGASASKVATDVKVTDFQVDVAKAGRSKCRECDNTVLKNEVRIGRREGAAKHIWYHLSCFAAKRQDYAFSFDPEKIPGFEELPDDDKKLVSEKLKTSSKRSRSDESTDEEQPAKKAKKQTGNGAAKESPEVVAYKKQNQDLWKLRDQLSSSLTKKDMTELLTHNGQEIPKGEDKILDRLCDCMLFGALAKCTECSGGQLVYSTTQGAYVCTGHVSGFTGCQFKTPEPKRVPFSIPDDLVDYDFLSTYVFKPGRERVCNPLAPRVSLSGCGESSATSITSRPLDHLKFVILSSVCNETKEKIRGAGGVIVSKVTADIIAVVAPKGTDELKGQKSEGKEVVDAKKAKVHVVTEDFVDEVKRENVAEMIEKFKKCDWGSDVGERIAKALQPSTSKKSGVGKSGAFKSQLTSQKVVVKGGAAVDAEFEYADIVHVYQDKNKNIFSAVLAKADVQSGHNSYYKLQLLEHDTAKKYWVFRAWGRTGTTIGGTKDDDFGADLEDAKEEFYRLYLEKTGNEWDNRKNFVKKPHCFYPVDVDYGQEEEETKSKVSAGSQSKLPKPVQELVKMIFDIEQMKQTMKEYEIDLQKMPLGKLSKKHIQDAYTVLTELQQELAGSKNQTKILDCTNRFFTLIPHDFGMNKPPLLNDTKQVQEKTEMLDALLEIEVAYSILKGDTGDRDPIDVHYEKLKTDVEVLDKSGAEFSMIKDYVKNTHAATHRQYELEIQDVFKISRHGEADRFAQFKSLHNRMLLWHGSRTSNYVGILSQGLRIAPPEAPVTGYMFGKGIYFADMVSKSANYCYTNQQNSTGLVMLCEVALGNMQEYKNAHNVTKLPNGKHSVKGVGQTAPDPKGFKTLDDGTVVPMGESKNIGVGTSSLLYNEYIVYDVNQVNIKYLIKMNFKYKF